MFEQLYTSKNYARLLYLNIFEVSSICLAQSHNKSGLVVGGEGGRRSEVKVMKIR